MYLYWKMDVKMFTIRVVLMLSSVSQAYTDTATSAVQINQTDFREVIYVPPAFSKELNISTNEESDEDLVTDDETPKLEDHKPPELPESQSFLNTAEQWFNFHLGTLALAVPVNQFQELVFKWHVGVYSKSETPYQQICGASLVTRSVAISAIYRTAAHCFWDDTSTALLPADQFAVAAGKRYRKWLRLQLHSSNVTEIIVPPRFLGVKTSFQDDIAVVKMATAVGPGFLTVQPLCVDFDLALDRKQLTSGNLGTITGFGLTEENGYPSKELNYQKLPYVGIRECINASEPSFLKYLTSDKICAGDQRTGRALCRGDSGGGLIFFEGNATFNIPYLRGIASAAPRNNNKCNAFAIASFTHLRTHRTFLRDHIPGLEEECRTVYAKELAEIARNRSVAMSSDKANGTLSEATQSPSVHTGLPVDEDKTETGDRVAKYNVNTTDFRVNVNDGEPDNYSDDSNAESEIDPKTEDTKDVNIIKTLPKLVRTIGESSAPGYQWHTAIYSKARKPYLQICGGTLVKRDVIISAAHCFKMESRISPASQFAAAAGKLYRPWADPRDEYAQYSNVEHIHVPKDFRAISTKLRSCYQHDVAVLTLTTPFSYAPGVRPACVDFRAELDRVHLQSGSFGKFVGWGHTQRKCAPHPKLHYRELPYVDLGCISDFSLSESDRFSDEDVCAVLSIVLGDARLPAYVKINPPCNTDSGGGLTYLDNRTSIVVPYLRGVATATIKGNKCNHFILDSFTHLRAEKEFLKTVIPDLEEECDIAYPEGLDPTMKDKDKEVRTGETIVNQSNREMDRPVNREGTQKDINGVIEPMNGEEIQRSLNKSHYGPIGNMNSESKPDAERGKSRTFNSNRSDQTSDSKIPNSGQFEPNLNVNFERVPFADPLDPSKINKPVIMWKKKNETALRKPISDMISYPVVESKTVELLGNSSQPAFPWHVGVYSKAWTPYMQICGGSLVKRDVVLSAAHCFWSDDFGPQSPAQFAVAAGKLHRPWIDPRDHETQYAHVSELLFPDRFVGIRTSYQDDIAVVRLTTPVQYGARVHPICVDFDVATEKQQLRTGALAKLAGWGLTEDNGRISERLNYVDLPFVEIKKCIRDTAPASLKYVTSDKICLGDQKIGRYLCKSDAGGGLAYFGAYPVIRGISSQAINGICDAVTLARFTHVSSHAAFLREHVGEIERECLDIYGHLKVGRRDFGSGALGEFKGPSINLVCNCNCDNSSRYRP